MYMAKHVALRQRSQRSLQHDTLCQSVAPKELRFKNKYRDMGKIKISAMTAEALDKVLKTRAIVRGDRAKQGIHRPRTRCGLSFLLQSARTWTWPLEI